MGKVQTAQKSVGQRLRKIREGLGISRTALSELLGFSGQYQVRDIETGRVKIPGPVLVLLKLKFGVSEKWLLSDTGSPFEGDQPLIKNLPPKTGTHQEVDSPQNGLTACQAACDKIHRMPFGQELLTDLYFLAENYPRDFAIVLADILKMADAVRMREDRPISHEFNQFDQDDDPKKKLTNGTIHYPALFGFELGDSRFFSWIRVAVAEGNFSKFESNPLAIGVIGVDSKSLIYANKALLDLTGVSLKQAKEFVRRQHPHIPFYDEEYQFITLSGLKFSSKKRAIDIDIYLENVVAVDRTNCLVGVIKPADVTIHNDE